MYLCTSLSSFKLLASMAPNYVTFFLLTSMELVAHNNFLKVDVKCCFQKKLDGYEFPVYSTNSCPRNQTEWNQRSSAINCTEDNGYLCLPNENITELLEFCYNYPFILIQEGKQNKEFYRSTISFDNTITPIKTVNLN